MIEFFNSIISVMGYPLDYYSRHQTTCGASRCPEY